MKNYLTVFTDDTFYGQAALAHAQKLAQIFDVDIRTIALTQKTDLHAIFSAEDSDLLFFVMPVGDSKKNSFFNVKNARKWIRKSRVPVFTTGKFKPDISDYQQIILPLEIHCQEKELALWASYFPAYFQKNCPYVSKENVWIHIIYNQFKDESLRKKVQNNIDFVIKMFDNLEVCYELHPFTNVDNIHSFSLKFAKTIKNSVLLYLMPEYYSLIDFIFGPVSNSLLSNKEQIPVFCLNARNDLFVLCR